METNLQIQMVIQDFTAAVKAFELDDFELMNILGNRVMSDSIFGNDGILALPGFFIKDLAAIYMAVKAQPPTSRFSDAKAVGKKYIDQLKGFVNSAEGINSAQIWEGFYNFKNNIRTFLISDIEKEVYKENPKITHAAFIWLLQYLKDKKEILFDGKSKLFEGVLNEMDRLYKVYGCETIDLYTMCSLLALDRYFEYFRIQYATPTGTVNEERVKTLIFPYVEKIAKLGCQDELIQDEINSLLWELIKVWRESFIQYTELPFAIPRRRIQLPEEARQKLSKAIGKAVERQAKS